MDCFKKAGILSPILAVHLKDFQESLVALKAADPDMVSEGLSSENVIDKDHDVFATAPCITEDGILKHTRQSLMKTTMIVMRKQWTMKHLTYL